MKDNSYALKHPETDDILKKYITDTDYIDERAFFANTPTQAKPRLDIQLLPTRSIDLYVKWDKTEFTYLKEDETISTLNDKPLKLVD